MSNNAPRNGNEKRAVLPKQLDKLDVALEREKSIKGKQNDSKTTGAKKPKAKYDAIGDSNQSSNVPSPETSSGAQSREKSPIKQQQRTSIIKVAVAASSSGASSNTPSKRPASAPVKPTAKPAASVTSGRASVVGKSVSPSKNDVKKSLAAGQDSASAKSRNATMDSNMAQQSDVDDGKGGALSDALADEEPPARGHYDIFIQTRQCENLCLSLGLALQHIRKMKKKYDANDMYCT